MPFASVTKVGVGLAPVCFSLPDEDKVTCPGMPWRAGHGRMYALASCDLPKKTCEYRKISQKEIIGQFLTAFFAGLASSTILANDMKTQTPLYVTFLRFARFCCCNKFFAG